ncbi:lolT-1 [Pholiota conissans]|uniref:LolT-1 n=1 Tax=Pholiota conissans TaxID=109636 RepID=A0A9P6CWM5_9AGAR|nr:lolT-1 [Pholiota conissans]
MPTYPNMQLKNGLKAYKEDKPEFGHGMLKYYALDPSYINLNNGSYGTTPRPVTEAVHALSERIEANPDLFHRIEFKPLLDEARQRVADLIGAKRDEVVFVANASMGVNTVLRNFEWEEGDIIFEFRTTYGSISRTVQYLHDRPPHPTASTINVLFPTTHAEIIEVFKKHVKANPALPNKKRVAVIDSIVSNPGVTLPWKELVKICKEEGIFSVIDAAHSIGQEVGVNLKESDPDFWISNCHKWLSAKRSCAALYVPERNQHIIKASIPTSHAYISPKDRKGPNFVEQFDWNGTIDYASYITVTDALEFREWMGGEERLNKYCHDLAIQGGQVLAEIFGTRVMDPNGDLTLNMVNVELPLPKDLPATVATISGLHRRLFAKKAFSAPFFHNGAWWTRCSAQVWNEISDFEELGKRWLEVCADVKKDFDQSK